MTDLQTFAARINTGIKQHGIIPMPSYQKPWYAREARVNGAGNLQLRNNRAWFYITYPDQQRIDALLQSKGI